ncbi:MAG TPA: PEP-CTERM sorting domain-containing protein [Vicinamibacterales bacterium]|nr:PEP-CTERM sorting domain-containing protein [Vicinamibacterales bacterium]
MRRVCQRVFAIVLLAGLVLVAAPANAAPILPGNTGVVPTGYLDPNNGNNLNFLAIVGPQQFTFGGPFLEVTVEYTLFVVRDPFNPGLYGCGTNCVDFGVDVTVVSGPPAGVAVLNSISLGGFGGANALIDVGYISNNFSPFAPTSADRAANGGVVTFNFAGGVPPPGQDVKPLSLRTDLTDWNGVLGVGFTATVTIPGHDPFHTNGVTIVSTPEPTSIVLLGSGALVALRRRKRA